MAGIFRKRDSSSDLEKVDWVALAQPEAKTDSGGQKLARRARLLAAKLGNEGREFDHTVVLDYSAPRHRNTSRRRDLGRTMLDVWRLNGQPQYAYEDKDGPQPRHLAEYPLLMLTVGGVVCRGNFMIHVPSATDLTPGYLVFQRYVLEPGTKQAPDHFGVTPLTEAEMTQDVADALDQLEDRPGMTD